MVAATIKWMLTNNHYKFCYYVTPDSEINVIGRVMIMLHAQNS